MPLLIRATVYFVGSVITITVIYVKLSLLKSEIDNHGKYWYKNQVLCSWSIANPTFDCLQADFFSKHFTTLQSQIHLSDWVQNYFILIKTYCICAKFRPFCSTFCAVNWMLVKNCYQLMFYAETLSLWYFPWFLIRE